MGRRKFPVVKGSAHGTREGKQAAESLGKGRDRDDLIEAFRGLRRARTREAKEATDSAGGESGVGVKSCKKAWDNHYPKGGKT